MADKKFTQLTAAGVLVAADLLAIAQSPFGAGSSKSITGTNLLSFVNANATFLPLAGGTMTGALVINVSPLIRGLTTTGSLESGFLIAHKTDAIVNAATVAMEAYHESTAGTPTLDNGASFDLSMDSATVKQRLGARITTSWLTAADATRTSQLRLFILSSGASVEAMTVTPTQASFVGSISAGTNIFLSATGVLSFVTRSRIKSSADGIIELFNSTNTDFTRLNFGGTSSSFPSLKRSSAGLIARLADDSADTFIQATAFNIGANPLNVTYSALSAGTAYTLTNTSALVDFGTTDPVITIAAAGTYRLSGWAHVKFNAATVSSARAITFKIRRTNNTPADVTNSSIAWVTEIISSARTGTYFILPIRDLFYTTANTNDVLELWAGIDVVPEAGTFTVVEAAISAIRVS